MNMNHLWCLYFNVPMLSLFQWIHFQENLLKDMMLKIELVVLSGCDKIWFIITREFPHLVAPDEIIKFKSEHSHFLLLYAIFLIIFWSQANNQRKYWSPLCIIQLLMKKCTKLAKYYQYFIWEIFQCFWNRTVLRIPVIGIEW